MAILGAVTGGSVYVVCRLIGKDLHVSVHSFFFALTTGFGGFLALAFSKYTINPMNM